MFAIAKIYIGCDRTLSRKENYTKEEFTTTCILTTNYRIIKNNKFKRAAKRYVEIKIMICMLSEYQMICTNKLRL